MSIVGWYNPLTKRLVPLDDPGMELVMPKEVLKYVVEKEQADTRHSGTNITVTASNGCARALAINRMLDTHPDPQKMWPMTGGTLLHKVLGDMVRNGEWWSEEYHPDKCTHIGRIGGVEMGCKIDLLRKDYGAIHDFKTSFKDKTKWIKPGDRATANNWQSSYAVQLSLCAELVQQATGNDMSEAELAIWIVSARWQKMFCDRLTINECLNAEVGVSKNYQSGKRWKYGEILEHIKTMFGMWNEAAVEYDGKLEEVPLRRRIEIVSNLPLFGESMFQNRNGGNMCTDYCAIAKDCKACGGGL